MHRSERVTLKNCLLNNSELLNAGLPDCKTQHLSLVNSIYKPPKSEDSPLLELTSFSKSNADTKGNTWQTTRGEIALCTKLESLAVLIAQRAEIVEMLNERSD